MEPTRRAEPLLPLVALAVACQSVAPAPDVLPAHVLRERIAAVEVGDTRGEVREVVGTVPVMRPGVPGSPFPTPLRTAEWRTPDGRRVRVEVYVVGARPAEGCPDVHHADVPLAFVDGRLVAKAWGDVERSWRGWGGELARLRALQERLDCEASGEAQESEAQER